MAQQLEALLRGYFTSDELVRITESTCFSIGSFGWTKAMPIERS